MKRRVALVLLLAPALAAPASAGIFFNKKADKPNPADRVPELVKALQTDGDEDKRMAAAAELRDYDVGQFPDIVPALIDALLNDKKAGVRAEAAQSLGKIRPVSDQVGMALEQSLSKDGSPRVRLQDRSALLQYRWNGWKEPAKKDDGPTARPKEPPPVQSKEPPLAPPPAPNIPPPPGKLNPQPEPMPNLIPVPSTPAPPPAPAGQDRGPDLGPPPR